VTIEATRAEWQVGSEVSYPEYAYLRDHSQSFEALAAHYQSAPLSVVADGTRVRRVGAVVSANYFSMLGVKPMLVAFFLPEGRRGSDRDAVAVIKATGMWQGRSAATLHSQQRNRIRTSVMGIHWNRVDPTESCGFLSEKWRGRRRTCPATFRG